MFQIRQAKAWLPLCVFLMCASSTAIAAAPSLGEMVSAAIARNPGMELAGAERGIADALQRKAEQPFAGDPSANLKYQTDAIGSDLGYREWEGGIDLPLWLPGQADGYAQEAARTEDVSQAITDTIRLETAGRVRERLWAAAIARSEAEQAQDALNVANRLFEDVQRRVQAGELPRSDRLMAEKELLQREERLQLARNQAVQAERLFTRYTGLDAPTRPPLERPELAAGQGTDHPLLQLAQQRVERARAHRDRVSGERRQGPNLWLGGKTAKVAAGYNYESAVGVELSMPFGTAGHAAPALAEAESALTQAQVEQAATRLDLEDAQTLASLELESATAALTQTARRLALAEESLALSRRAFELGETDLVRLLQAQADALSARHDDQIRQLEHGQAIARLNQALGVIPQ